MNVFRTLANTMPTTMRAIPTTAGKPRIHVKLSPVIGVHGNADKHSVVVGVFGLGNGIAKSPSPTRSRAHKTNVSHAAVLHVFNEGIMYVGD